MFLNVFNVMFFLNVSQKKTSYHVYDILYRDPKNLHVPLDFMRTCENQQAENFCYLVETQIHPFHKNIRVKIFIKKYVLKS